MTIYTDTDYQNNTLGLPNSSVSNGDSSGDDVYVFNPNNGQDTIKDDGGNDTLILNNINSNQIMFQYLDKTLRITGYNGNNYIDLFNYFSESGKRIETFQFTDKSIGIDELISNPLVLSSAIPTGQNDLYIANYWNGPIVLTQLPSNQNNYVSTGMGNDVIYDSSGDDNISTGGGDDIIYSRQGNDILSGGSGSDTYIIETNGHKKIYETTNNTADYDVLQLIGLNYSDARFTMNSSQQGLTILNSNNQNFSIFLSQGNQYSNTNNIEELQFKDITKIWNTWGESLQIDFTTIDTLSTDWSNTARFNQQAVTYLTNNSNSTITSGNGDDIILGGSGLDNMNGNAGNDLIWGGRHNDNLNGGADSDTYVFQQGHGIDKIATNELSDGSKDILKFIDILESDIEMFQGLNSSSTSGSHLIIKNKNSTDYILVTDFYKNNPNRNPYDEFEFVFADTIPSLQNGTYGNDILYGNKLTNTINAAAGNDIILAGAGALIANGGNGHDYIKGSILADSIDGGNGADTLFGGASNDILNGNAGNDVLYGEAGSDTLTGGLGNDVLYGGDPDDTDTYIFDINSGHDLVIDGDITETDILIFNNILSTQAKFKRTDNDLVIYDYAGANASVTVQNYFNHSMHAFNKKFQFSDKTIDLDYMQSGLIYFDIIGRVPEAPWDIHITTQGSSVSDNIQGNAPYNYLYGYEGNDKITGNQGPDVLYGHEGDDILDGDGIYGRGHSDSLYGGIGNDTLYGGIRSDPDFYYFYVGDGNDIVIDTDDEQHSDTLVFGEQTSSSAKFTRSGNDLIVKYGISDQVTVKQYFDKTVYAFHTKFKFTDKTIDYAALSESLDINYMVGTTGIDKLIGTAYSDNINGLADNDSLYGYGSKDTINGGLGNDYIDGGVGNDILYGGNGNDADTYVLRIGSGGDSIIDVDDSSAIDTVFFADGILSTSAQFQRSGNDLIVSGYGTASDMAVIKQYLLNGSLAVNKQFKFKDKTITLQNLQTGQLRVNYLGDASANTLEGSSIADAISGLAGNDTLKGHDGNDSLQGGIGNDVLFGHLGNDGLNGNEGNDVLNGGKGNDNLYGGVGNDADSYIFFVGDGSDTVVDTDDTTAIDTLRFINIQSSAAKFTKSGNDLIVDGYGASTDKVTIKQFYDASVNAGNKQFQFSDKTISASQISALTQQSANLKTAMSTMVDNSASIGNLPSNNSSQNITLAATV